MWEPTERRLHRQRQLRQLHAGQRRVRARTPDGVDPLQIAPVLCAGVTVHKGLKVTDTQPGQWVAISGIGGLGHIAVQYARAMGLRVVAIDVDDAKLALTAQFGAEVMVNARTPQGVRTSHRFGSAWQHDRVQRTSAGRTRSSTRSTTSAAAWNAARSTAASSSTIGRTDAFVLIGHAQDRAA